MIAGTFHRAHPVIPLIYFLVSVVLSQLSSIRPMTLGLLAIWALVALVIRRADTKRARTTAFVLAYALAALFIIRVLPRWPGVAWDESMATDLVMPWLRLANAISLVFFVALILHPFRLQVWALRHWVRFGVVYLVFRAWWIVRLVERAPQQIVFLHVSRRGKRPNFFARWTILFRVFRSLFYGLLLDAVETEKNHSVRLVFDNRAYTGPPISFSLSHSAMAALLLSFPILCLALPW